MNVISYVSLKGKEKQNSTSLVTKPFLNFPFLPYFVVNNNCIMLNMLSDSALLQISSEFVFRLKVVFEGCFSLLIFCCSEQAVILLFTKWHIITFTTFSSTLNFLAAFGNLVTILIQFISERFINSDFILFFYIVLFVLNTKVIIQLNVVNLKLK